VPGTRRSATTGDPNHKPELLCALTEFDALCGFRPVRQTLRLLAALDVAELAPYRELLAAGGLRAAFTALVELDEPGTLVAAVVAGLPRLAGTEWADLGAALTRVARDFPGDRGLAVALLLNFVRLAPVRRSSWAPATCTPTCKARRRDHGQSDNVLRCGLTAKHIDVAELVRITDFTPLAEPDARRARAGSPCRCPTSSCPLSTSTAGRRSPRMDRRSCSVPTAVPGCTPRSALASRYVAALRSSSLPDHAATVTARQRSFALDPTWLSSDRAAPTPSPTAGRAAPAIDGSRREAAGALRSGGSPSLGKLRMPPATTHDVPNVMVPPLIG